MSGRSGNRLTSIFHIIRSNQLNDKDDPHQFFFIALQRLPGQLVTSY